MNAIKLFREVFAQYRRLWSSISLKEPIWQVQLDGIVHEIRIKHNWLGKLSVIVDGTVLSDSVNFSLHSSSGNIVEFAINNHNCFVVSILKPNKVSHKYDLFVDGHSVSTGKPGSIEQYSSLIEGEKRNEKARLRIFILTFLIGIIAMFSKPNDFNSYVIPSVLIAFVALKLALPKTRVWYQGIVPSLIIGIMTYAFLWLYSSFVIPVINYDYGLMLYFIAGLLILTGISTVINIMLPDKT